MKYRITNQKDLRRGFWKSFPDLPRKKIPDHSGNGRMYHVDARCAFVDWIDMLSKNGDISQALAERTTL